MTKPAEKCVLREGNMSDTREILILGFEVPYSDESGIQYGVRYDSEANNKAGEIEFNSIDKIAFPAARLQWLIDALNRIQEEVSKRESNVATEPERRSAGD